ncbi:MAG TPA: DUF6167 family protein [Nocardioidaceae bacterium]|nr:DUF6167 family protein [Nocardioidaceae bacterium]
MSRTLWFVAGATTGVYVLTKARRAAEALTPEGLRDRLAGLSLGAHLIHDEVRTEMATRENDLRERLGLHLIPELSGPVAPPGALHPDNSDTREGNS